MTINRELIFITKGDKLLIESGVKFNGARKPESKSCFPTYPTRTIKCEILKYVT